MRRKALAICLILLLILSAGCTVSPPEGTDTPVLSTQIPTTSSTQPPTQPPTESPTQPPTETPTEAPTEPPTEAPTEPKILVVIDPGHQAKGNYDKEPVGPGASEMKAKVSSGTQGVVTRLEEYKLTLALALKLEQELLARGYEVLLTRRTHDVDISNAQRAQMANEAKADAFIRIHGNAVDDPNVHGALTMCQTKKNPYNGELYQQSRALSEAVLDGLVASAQCQKRSILESDTMSGINWCKVPTTIVEAGFMSNPQEDQLMSTEEYQNKLAVGMANGIDAYFGRN